MRYTHDPLSSLISPAVLPHLEQMSLPFLGYHFLRENLTQKLLGESEAPILFWLGKDLGKQIAIQKISDLTLAFIRLGLGKLEVYKESPEQYSFTLHHSCYSFTSVERLRKTLSLECGILVGAVSRWQGKETEAQFELQVDEKDRSEKKAAKISIRCL